MLPCDAFMNINNRKARNWNEDDEPRQCAIYQDEQEGEPQEEMEVVEG